MPSESANVLSLASARYSSAVNVACAAATSAASSTVSPSGITIRSRRVRPSTSWSRTSAAGASVGSR